MTVTAILKTKADAQAALMQLEAAGISENQISLLMTDKARGSHFELVEGDKIDEGAAAGATFGGVVGAILGAVLSAGTIAIPGLNIIVTGALASGLAGLGAGAATGGLIGGLIGAGIPEHEAKFYEKEVRGGNVLIAVNVKDNDEKKAVMSILKGIDAYNIAA